MNRKLVKASLAGAAVIALAAGGSTYAAWSDFADVTGNNVGAGVLKMTLTPNSQNPGDDLKFDNVKLAPGSYFEKQVYVATNDGTSTPSARLFFSMPRVEGHENGCDTNSEATQEAGTTTLAGDSAAPCNNLASNPGQLIDQATMSVVSYLPNADKSCTYEYAPAGAVVSKPVSFKLKDWPAKTPIELTADNTGLNNTTSAPYSAKEQLAPGDGLCVQMILQLQNTALNGISLGDAAQGDTADFDLHFEVQQSSFAPANKDYFTG